MPSIIPRFSLVACLLLISTLGSNARADFIIEIGSKSIAVGGIKAIDVLVSSADSNGVEIGFYDLEFLITPASATPGTSLQFENPQAESHLSSGDYLFHSISSGTPTTFVSGTANNTLFASDFADPMGNAQFTTSTLLATLDLSHHLPTGVSTGSLLGDVFEIQIVNATFEVYDGTDYVAYGGSFSSNIGLVTVAAVPEPSSFGLLSVFSMALIFSRRRRSFLAA